MIFQCQHCGVEFKSSHKSKFCGVGCYGVSKRGSIPWNKGKKTGIKPWLGKKRDPETIAKMQATKIARPYSHPQSVRDRISKTTLGRSKGGVSAVAALIRGTSPYKNWRTAIYKRDDYTCQQCGVRGGKLNADHKTPFSVLLRRHKIKTIMEAAACSELWNLDNGKTLCVPCHLKTPTHGHYSRAADMARAA